jgi:glycosyltransferase involved in cell wall biosynthesis
MKVAVVKVLIVHPEMILYGGAEVLIVRLANYLSSQGIGNAVLTTGISPEIERDLQGSEIIKYPFKPAKGLLARLKNLVLTTCCLHKGLCEHASRFDVVNPHNFPASLAVFPLNMPCVWMCNEPPETELGLDRASMGTLKRLVFKFILACDHFVVRNNIINVVVADRFNSERFERLYGLKPRIVNYGIDFGFFSTGSAELYEKPGTDFRVIQVGMLTPLKNQLESVRTIEKLRSVIPGIKLILAGFGEGAYLSSINDYIAQKGLQQHVRITGHLNRFQVRELYHSCDVLLHPIKPQGGWLSPFEAISAGLPVVVSKEMTAADLMLEHDLGVVTDDYSAGILEIYNNRDKYCDLAEQRAQWVHENLTWDRFCGKMLEFYKEVLSG